MLIEIKSRFTGRVLFSRTAEGNTIKATVEAAVSARANLADANLGGAHLTGAYLTGAYLAGAYLAGADLADANLAGAYLAGANLTGAYLGGAYLGGANLTGAYLRGAKWRDGITLTRAPLQLHGLRYSVTILDSHMQIGCKLYALAEWVAFTDAEIAEMDRAGALEFWRAHKAALLALAASDGRGEQAAAQEAA